MLHELKPYATLIIRPLPLIPLPKTVLMSGVLRGQAIVQSCWPEKGPSQPHALFLGTVTAFLICS
jgi:hypothetical protein